MNNKKKTIFLTSSLSMSLEDEYGNKKSIRFPNDNNIVDNLKKKIKKYDNFLYIPSYANEFVITQPWVDLAFSSFSKTLPFKNYELLDERNIDQAKSLINKADFIYLSGGHLPSQNEFFNKINLKDLLKKSDAVICGASAGSMNCASDVYCTPELEGEAIDKNFKRSLPGLGLTNINLLPHYEDVKDILLDGLKYMEEIVYPDSIDRDIYILPDGSYFLIDDEVKLYGEGYLLKNKILTKINDNKKTLVINH